MLEIVITSSMLILVLTMLRRVWQGKISCRLQYALWLLVAVRLLVPLPVFGNTFSVMNVVYHVTEGGREGHAVADGEKTESGMIIFRLGTEAATGQEDIRLSEILPEGEKDAQTGNARWSRIPSGADRDLSADKSQTGRREPYSGMPKRIFLCIWCAGMAVTAGWMLACNVNFRRRLYRGRCFLYNRGRISVYVAENLDSPCLFGIFAPAVYLTPASLQTKRYREHAIAHELTHYRHGDQVWALVRSLCAVIYWYNPLVWLGVKLSLRDCELACDEGTLCRLGENQREPYGATLIEMASAHAGKARHIRCTVDMSCGKRELTERITQLAAGRRKKRRYMAILAVCCGALLAACSFGGAREEAAMGRYVESPVELPEADGRFVEMVQDGQTIRVVHDRAKDLVSRDGGNTFEESEESGAGRGKWLGMTNHTASPDGCRTFTAVDKGKKNYICLTADGRETVLIEPEYSGIGSTVLIPYYGVGYFYEYSIQGGAGAIYRVNVVDGEMEFLTDFQDEIWYMAADDSLLYIVTGTGVSLFGLEEGQQSARQDEVLSAFMAEKAAFSTTGHTVLLYPYQEGVYILTYSGLYWHELYGEAVEQVINGRFCGIGDEKRKFLGMALLEREEEPEFLIAFSDGTLARYIYDKSMASVPEALRIYSVYEDGNVSQAVNAFRKKYPDIPILYQVGAEENYGMTLEDTLKNLATEIAAGRGPDILVMDDIPLEAYEAKGALLELSSFQENMGATDYFGSVVDGYRTEKGLYTIPMTFAIPVLAGKADKIAGTETLADLADLLEQEREAGTEGPVFTSWDAVSTLRLLAESSQGAWLADGNIDREAVTEFLIQAGRIYEAVAEDPPEFVLSHNAAGERYFWSGGYPLERWFDCEGISSMIQTSAIHDPGQPCHAGYLSGAGEDYIYFAGGQQYLGETCVMMPGQQYGKCLAATLLAVNSATKRTDECMKFLEYAFSEEFQRDASLNGTPVNREAYRSRKEFKGRKYAFYYSLYDAYYFVWPTEEDFGRLDYLLESVTGVNRCSSRVYETVVELGQAALTGESTVDEAVDAIEKKVRLFLAE